MFAALAAAYHQSRQMQCHRHHKMATEHLFEKVAVGSFCARRGSWAVFSAIRDTTVTFVRFHVTRPQIRRRNRPPVFLALCQTRYMRTMPRTLLAAYLTSSMQGFVKVIAVSKVIAWEYHPCVLDIYDHWLANDDDSLLSLSRFFFFFIANVGAIFNWWIGGMLHRCHTAQFDRDRARSGSNFSVVIGSFV